MFTREGILWLDDERNVRPAGEERDGEGRGEQKAEGQGKGTWGSHLYGLAHHRRPPPNTGAFTTDVLPSLEEKAQEERDNDKERKQKEVRVALPRTTPHPHALTTCSSPPRPPSPHRHPHADQDYDEEKRQEERDKAMRRMRDQRAIRVKPPPKMITTFIIKSRFAVDVHVRARPRQRRKRPTQGSRYLGYTNVGK